MVMTIETTLAYRKIDNQRSMTAVQMRVCIAGHRKPTFKTYKFNSVSNIHVITYTIDRVVPIMVRHHIQINESNLIRARKVMEQ